MFRCSCIFRRRPTLKGDGIAIGWEVSGERLLYSGTEGGKPKAHRGFRGGKFVPWHSLKAEMQRNGRHSTTMQRYLHVVFSSQKQIMAWHKLLERALAQMVEQYVECALVQMVEQFRNEYIFKRLTC